MAPIGDDTQTLKDLVHKLESRVKQLEDKLTHAQSGTKPAAAEGVRMILMGPPGAGMLGNLCFPSSIVVELRLISLSPGKGTQAPKIKERFSCCHLVGDLYILGCVGMVSDIYEGYWRYASVTSCKEDTFRQGSQENHGPRWTC